MSRARHAGEWDAAVKAWGVVVTCGAAVPASSYTEAVRCLLRGGRWSAALTVQKLVRAEMGHTHKCLQLHVPAPSAAELFAAEVGRMGEAATLDTCVSALRRIDEEPALRPAITVAMLDKLYAPIEHAVLRERLSPSSLTLLRHLAALAPLSTGPLFTNCVHTSLLDEPLEASRRAAVDESCGWRLSEHRLPLGFPNPRCAATAAPGFALTGASSLLLVDATAITSAFSSVVHESRHHSAIVTTHQVLRLMFQTAAARTAAGAAARKHLRLLLLKAARVYVVGFGDELRIRSQMDPRDGDCMSPDDTLAAVGVELAQRTDLFITRPAVVAMSASRAVRLACHRHGVPFLTR